MMADPFANPTSRSVIGRHDGHADHNLNCIVVRHGWTRTFSIPPEELENLDYETLESILEVHTLKLRPVGVRIFVEHPPESGTWLKIRAWRANDGSLQSLLAKNFFIGRHSDGILTRLEVRDGTGRQAEGDTMSLRSVGSRIFHPRDRSSDAPKPPPKSHRRSVLVRWLGLGKAPPTPMQTATTPGSDGHEEEQELVEAAPQKPSFFSLLRPQPQTEPASVRRSIFDFFRARQQEPTPEPDPDPEAQKKAEEEILRKRGWMPPNLVKKSRSFLSGDSSARNPFLGSSRSLTRRKKAAKDPFADGQEADDAVDLDAQELTQQDIDDFYEIERPESMEIMESEPNTANGKNWSRFRSKEKKGKKKNKSRLGLGAEIVATPGDAFPNPAENDN